MAANPKRLLVLVAALSLAAACQRAPVEHVAEPTPNLPPPAPSATVAKSSPSVSPPAYITEMPAVSYPGETAATGKPSQDPLPSLSKAERKKRLQQMRDMAKELARVRRGIEKSRDKTVTLPGDTVGLIPKSETGRALTDEVESSTPSAVKK